MEEHNESAKLQERFGDRFDGMLLTHIETLYWPVWLHTLTYSVYESVDLDPLEEGLLCLAQAGVDNVVDVATLLGCSERYANEMAARLSETPQKYSCLTQLGHDRFETTSATSTAIAEGKRKISGPQSLSLIRDAVFGDWLSLSPQAKVKTIGLPNPEDGQHRCLAPVVREITKDQDITAQVLRTLDEVEVIDATLVETGTLDWITLKLACYQPTAGGRGRFLLFNPDGNDSPMLEMTQAFEQELGRKPIKLYFHEGLFETASMFWDDLARRITAERATAELVANKAHLALARQREEQTRQAVEASDVVLEVMTAPASEDAGADLILPLAVKNQLEELAQMERAVTTAEQKVRQLEEMLLAMPRTDHLEAKDHPKALREAICSAKHTLILICPWIKKSIVQSYLKDIDAALARGVQIVIGYGMPVSPHHQDNTDDSALQLLRKRETTHKLCLAHLGTHEKVIIQDDELFINTSFNFLSYDGGSERRESGTWERGSGVARIRDKFIAAFPQEIQAQLTQSVT